MNTETDTNSAGFPLVPCTRCNGTGEFSYCSAYGKTCIKCWGQRFTIAPHAVKAWNAYTNASRPTITFAEVKVGDKVNYNKRWVVVDAITVQDTTTTLHLANGATYGGQHGFTVETKVDTDAAPFLAMIKKVK